jgi:hypothetical protein
VLSRVHWHTLTIWTQPTQDDGKPSVEFTKLVHTPIAESKEKRIRIVQIEPDVPTVEQIELVSLYLPMLRSAIKNAGFRTKNKEYASLIVPDRVPSKYLFDLSKVKQAIIIGPLPKPEELPLVLRNRLFGRAGAHESG